MKRRIFLRGMGGAALATPFLSSLQTPARASGSTTPRRWVTFYTGNGVQMDNWFPQITDGALAASHFQGTSLEVLAPHAPKLLFPRGLSMTPRGFYQDHFDPHDQGMGSKLTARPLADASPHYPVGHSADFEAAWRVNPGGKNPLVLLVGRAGLDGVKSYTSYSAPETPYPGETNPLNIYGSLTGLFSDGEGFADYVLARRESIIDLVDDDLQSFKRLPMSNADQRKVDDWLALLRETELGVPTQYCTQDIASNDLGLSESEMGGLGGFGVSDEMRFVTGGDLMIKLAVLTMLCDANRVITLQWQSLGGPTFTWDGMNHNYTHHQISHRTGSDAANAGDHLPGVEEMVMEIDRWYAGRYKKLLDLADSFEEDDGTLLDHSAIVWLNELADGEAHNNDNLPTIIAGGAGGYLQTGRSIDLGIASGGGFNGNGGTHLTKLYTTLLNALGAEADGGGPIESFGDQEYGDPGEIDEIKA